MISMLKAKIVCEKGVFYTGGVGIVYRESLLSKIYIENF